MIFYSSYQCLLSSLAHLSQFLSAHLFNTLTSALIKKSGRAASSREVGEGADKEDEGEGQGKRVRPLVCCVSGSQSAAGEQV